MASLPLFNSYSYNSSRSNNTNSQTFYHNDQRKHSCEANGIFWKAEGSKNSQPNADAYIPGVNNPCNSKKSKKLKWQPYKVQPKSSTISSEHVVKDLSHSSNESNENCTGSQSGSQRSVSFDSLETKKVFLKDLCHEDKLRIANLIQELAKAGEQREDAISKLSQEREDYKKRVSELTDQVQLLSDEHKQTLCKMTDCHHLLNLYQHILIEQQQKKRHSMPMMTNTSKHNKENTSHRAKRQNHSLPSALPPRSLPRAQPLGNSTHLGENLQPRNSVCRSLSPSPLYQNSLHPPARSRQRRSLSPRYPRPDSLVSATCDNHQRTHRQRRSLSPSSFPPDSSYRTQHPKLNSNYLLPRANEVVSRLSPQTSPHFSDRQLGDGSPMSQLRPLIPETIRPNLKPATSIFKTSPSAPIPYDKIRPCDRSNSDIEGISEFPRHYQRSPTSLSVCSNNSASPHNSVFANSEHTPESNKRGYWSTDKMLSPNVSFPPKNATFANKSKTRLSLGPLQDPIMSSTRRSSELRSNASFVSQNTANNQSCGFQSPSGSVQSLPACFQSKKNESADVCAPLKFETAQSDTDYSYVRKLSFSSSVQSLPTDFTRHRTALHSAPPAAVQDTGSATVSKVSFANFDKDLSNSVSPTRSVHGGKGIKVPGTPDTDCFHSMSNQERRQFLLQQRALLEEEQHRLLALLKRPDLNQSVEKSSSMSYPREGCEGVRVDSQIKSKTNIIQGLDGVSLITNNLPLNSLEKLSKSEPILETNKTDPQLLQPLMPTSPLTPPQTYNSHEVEDFPTIADECCSVQSNCSFTSKQSSMSLIDLIDSIELKPEEDNQNPEPCTTPQNSLRVKDFSEQNRNTNFSPNELKFEDQVLQDIFFLN